MTVRRAWAGRLAVALACSLLLVGWTGGRADAFLGPVVEKIQKVVRSKNPMTGMRTTNLGYSTPYSASPILRGFPVTAGGGAAKMGIKTVVGRIGVVGAVLTAGQIAYWAYSELDGGAAAPQPGGEAKDWIDLLLPPDVPYPNTLDDGMITAEVTAISGRDVTMEIGCAAWVSYYSGALYGCGGSTNGESFGVATANTTVHDLECRDTTTNVKTIREAIGSWTRSAWVSPGDRDPVVRTVTNLCNVGEVVEGIRIGPSDPRHSGATWRQTEPIGSGSLQGEGAGEWPEGTVVFNEAVIDATCKNAETGEIQHIYTSSDWGNAEQLMLPSCKQRLGSQWYGVGIDIIPMTPTVGGDELQDWPAWDSDRIAREGWEPAPLTPAEELDPCHVSASGCGYTVWADGELCVNGLGACSDLLQKQRLDPDSVVCKWGVEEVAFKYCAAVVSSLSAPTQTVTDPTTGPRPDPDDPSTTPETTIPDGTDVSESGSECLKWAGGWNPFVWVYKPVMCALRKAFVPDEPPAFGDITSPLPPGWVPDMPALGGGTCGPVEMPSGLNFGPLLPSAGGGELFDTCDYAAARNVTFYGTLALLLVVTGRRAFGAVMDALGMQVKGDLF